MSHLVAEGYADTAYDLLILRSPDQGTALHAIAYALLSISERLEPAQ